MDYRKSVLSNGVRVITSTMPTLSSATLTVWYKIGSRYETDSQAGISHFLEHMIFKGGKKYKNAKAVAEAFDSIGADNNAATSNEYTYYYARSAASQIGKCFDILSDSLNNSTLPPKEVARERDVILEEISMYEDDAKDYVGIQFDRLIWGDTALGRDVIGTRETVSAVSSEALRDYQRQNYTGENVIITVAGGVSHRKVLALASRYFSHLPRGSKNETDLYADQQNEPRANILYRDDKQSNLVVGFPGFAYGSSNRYEETVLSAILSGGMSSRLFTEVREKRGLAYAVAASSSHYSDVGDFYAYAGTNPKKASEAVKVILQEFYELGRGRRKIKKEELRKAKEYIKGHLTLSMESTKSVGSFFGMEELMLGEERDFDEVLREIEAVTDEEVVALAREIFVPEKVNLSVIGPHRKGKEFLKIIN